jgi:ABC-2 type transport system permease protein
MRSLFKARLRQLKNVLRGVGWRQYLLLVLLGGGVLFLMGFFAIKVFGFLYHREEFPLFFKLFLSEKILMMTFLTMFMMLIMSALISTLNIFFLSKDLELLISSPLRARAIFAWKAVETASSSSLMVVFFSLPVLFGYCYYFAPGLPQIAAVVLVFVLYMVTGVLVGILTGLIIPAFISVKRLQPVLSVVSIILISGIVIFLRMLKPERFGNPEVIDNLVGYMSGLDTQGLSWSPFYWTAKAFHLVAKKDLWGYLKILLAFGGVIVFLGAFAYFLQKKYYLQLFDKLNKGSGGSYRSGWKTPRLIKTDYRPLWNKEIKTFLRTPAQWSQLLIVAAIVIVFILNIKGIPLPHVSVKNIIAYLNLGMAAFIVAGLNSRFTFTTMPMEYPGIIHVLASPFPKPKLLRFKLWFYAAPLFLVGFTLFLAGDLALELDRFNRISGFFFLLPVLLVLTLLSLYFSMKVDESVPLTPQHLVGSKNGISFMIWSLVYIVAGMIYFLRPTFLYYYSRFLSRAVPTVEIALWFAAFWLINLLLMMIFYKRSISLWRKKEF